MPGQPGAKKFVAQDGDRAGCARYREDDGWRGNLTTVEVVEDCTPWEPGLHRMPHTNMLSLRVKYGEVEGRTRSARPGADGMRVQTAVSKI